MREKDPSTRVRMITGNSTCQCNCSKQRDVLTYFTLFIAITALCLVAVMYMQGHERGFSDEETELLLTRLRELESKNVREGLAVVSGYHDPGSQGLPYILHRVRREADAKPKKPKKHRKKKRCPRHCRKKGKRGPMGPTGPTGPQGPPGPPGIAAAVLKNRQTIKAAHFMPDFWKDRKDLEKGIDLCKFVDKWGGKACRNRTLEMTTGTMNFFHPAKWIEENEHITSPVELLETGEFLVKDEGLYLLYSSITFYDSKMKESHALVVNGTKLFRCMEGVDYVNSSESRAYNSKYRTCSITGVTYLQKWHRVAVENLYNKTMIDLTKDVTFFGLVQLVPGMEGSEEEAQFQKMMSGGGHKLMEGVVGRR